MQKNKENISGSKSWPKSVDDFKKLKIELLGRQPNYSDNLLLSLYSALCKATKAGFWIYELQNNKLFFSLELAELLSLPQNHKLLDKEIRGRPGYDELLESFVADLNEVVESKSILEREYHIKSSKDQKQSKVFNTIYQNFKSLETTGNLIIGIVVDITEAKKAKEELLHEKEKAEESNSIINTFLNNISHEIRTPMNAIIGFTELLNIGEISVDKKQEYLTIIKNKSRNLLSLIDDISELSKFESGKVLLNKTDTNLSKLLNEILHESLKERINKNKSNVEIYLKLPNDKNLVNVYTDPGRIQQVLSYLVDNALKYTEKGYIQFGYDLKDNRNLLFFVKDTGIGIHKEAQKNLFNRFRIKEEVFDNRYHNTGLGLTIARAIVENLGGKIFVDSTIGHGSNFYFTIPFHKSSAIIDYEINEKINPLLNWRNKVILIAEDDIVNYQFLEAVLADTQAQLVHVLDGAQAVELCNTLTHIDLILMDIRMPEKSGYDAVKEIRKNNPNIPIIAQTAYTSKEDREKCIEVGCTDYISKPIDINLLFELINKYFAE